MVEIQTAGNTAAHQRLVKDVLDGLTGPFKELPPKYFYDTRGSELFDQITELPEYYPTQAELGALRKHASEIVQQTGAGELVELGAGATLKARVLLDAMREHGTLRRYVPFDVSQTYIDQAAASLATDYPDLPVQGVVGDFERGSLDHIGLAAGGVPRLVALLGGTIGNFKPAARRAILARIAALLRPGDRLLLGTDLVKDPAVIEAAYNDAAGVTAAFNANILHVLNRELGADFDVPNFEHVAFFDRKHEWIEMRLRARQRCVVYVRELDLRVEFAEGEELRTEVSAKFTPARISADLAFAGLALVRWDTDAEGRFAISLSRPEAPQ
jgi:L-histidine Nalpha-methyltransferase